MNDEGGGGGGERRNLFSPPPPRSTFFCFRSNFRAITRLQTLAMQAKKNVKNLPLLICLWFLLPSLTELQRFLFPFGSFLPFLITSPQLSSSFSVTEKTTSYKSVFNNFLFIISIACRTGAFPPFFSGERGTKRAWSARHVPLRIPKWRLSGALYSLRACLRSPEKREKKYCQFCRLR